MFSCPLSTTRLSSCNKAKMDLLVHLEKGGNFCILLTSGLVGVFKNLLVTLKD